MVAALGYPTRRSFLVGGVSTLVSLLSVPHGANAWPRRWARPIPVDGVPNLHRVSANFYRSAQPTAIGIEAVAKKYHIRTVISLRHWHSDNSLVAGTSIHVTNIPMNTWHIETEDVVRALKLLRAAQEQGPVLLHCQHGADRTGLITALYRIVYQGWNKDQALDEMLHGGFGYHAVWGNIPDYVRNVDIAWLRGAVRQ